MHLLSNTSTYPTLQTDLDELQTRSGRIGRSTMEIDQDLSPIIKKINSEWHKSLGLLRITLPVSRKLIYRSVTNPVSSFFKLGLLALFGYLAYMLFRGTFAGIEVDFDSNFRNIFSKDKDERLYTGLNLTNGDQGAQFVIDGLVTAYAIFKLFIEKPYCHVAGERINDCFQPYLVNLQARYSEMCSKIDSEEDGNDKFRTDLLSMKENLNRLYKHLESDLQPYEALPRVCSENVLTVAPLQGEAEIDLSHIEEA